MTAASRARFAALVRAEPVDVTLACLLMGCETEPDLDLDASLAVLDALAAAAEPLVRSRGPAEGLRVSLGGEAGFAGTPADFDDLRSSLLHEVLRRGRGLPIMLSLVWCEVADRLGVTAVPLGLPGHVLVAVEGVVVDPFRGGIPAAGPLDAVLDPLALLTRVLTNIRVLMARQERSLDTARTRLWATELALLLPSHSVQLRKEQGELMVRLGDHVGGAVVLEDYADVIEDAAPDEATAARRSARQARARLN